MYKFGKVRISKFVFYLYESCVKCKKLTRKAKIACVTLFHQCKSFSHYEGNFTNRLFTVMQILWNGETCSFMKLVNRTVETFQCSPRRIQPKNLKEDINLK